MTVHPSADGPWVCVATDCDGHLGPPVRTAVRAVAAVIHRELVPERVDWQLVLVGRDGSLERVEWGEAFGGWFARPRFVPLVSPVSSHEDRRVDVFGYDLSYVHGRYVMSGNRVIETLPTTVVRVTTADGVEGFGEVCPLGPAYLPAHGAGARAALRELAPAVLGIDAGNLGAVNAAMDRALMGHGYAKSAIDTACWDALGRSVGLPVCDLLGGRLSDRLPALLRGPARVGGGDDRVRRRRGGRRASTAFQLKIGADPYEDAARTRSVVEATGPEDIVVADANGGWHLQDAVDRRARDRRPRAGLLRAAVPDARGVPDRAAADDAADGARRVHPRRPLAAARVRGEGDGGVQPQDLEGRRPHAGEADARPRRRARPARHDRGHVGRRHRHGRRLASRRQHAARHPVHGLVHERLDERARRRATSRRSQDGFGSAPTTPGLGVDVDVAALGAPLFSAA